MKVILLGNIGTGKSTIANLLIHNYMNAEYIAIDDIREFWGDGTEKKEAYCKSKFINSVSMNSKMQILELTGVGVLGENLFNKLANYKYSILVIHLIVDKQIILNRIKEKKMTSNFPLPVDCIYNAIEYTDKSFKEGLIDKLLWRCANALYIPLLNNDSIMLKKNIAIIQSFIRSYYKDYV